MVVDCAAVETGCMLEKYIPGKGCNRIGVHFYVLVEVLGTAACCCGFLPS